MESAAVVIDNAYKKFDKLSVLDGVSLTCKKGKATVVIGPSGCGKSTLLRTINGLESLDSGVITVNGKNLISVDQNEIRREVGMVFQHYSLFPHLTVLENLTLAPRYVLRMSRAVAEKKAEELLYRVGLYGKAESYPRQLSGGQSQRVAIARALMLNPTIMLFDEVTSALDPELSGEVLEVMRDLLESGMTMVIITHEMGFARSVGDHLVFMDGGVIVEQGEPSKVLNNPSHSRTQQFLKRVMH